MSRGGAVRSLGGGPGRVPSIKTGSGGTRGAGPGRTRPPLELPLAFLGYSGAALALTFPAWAHPTSRWIGALGDPSKFMEFLAWYPFAISHGLNPLHNGYVNLPSGSNMMWDTTVPLVAVLVWPVTAVAGVIASWNVAVFGALVLDGWCTLRWLSRHVERFFAAWVGGLMMVLGPFAAARAHGHLNLLLFFPLPLIFVEVEKFLLGTQRSAWRTGLRVGLLGAVELLCCEEFVALGFVALGTALLIALRSGGSCFRRFWADGLRAMVVGAAVFFLFGGGPLIYQLLGPGRIVGPVQPINTYVTDLLNVVVPTKYTALAPTFAIRLSSHWTGTAIESDAYVGVPLLAIGLYVVIRWWRERWLRVIGLSTAAMLVWSLGPYPHLDGMWQHAVPLPTWLLARLPVTENILPARFSLFMDFGLAAVVAIFVDRCVLDRGRRRVLSSAAMVLAVATLAPRLPIGATPSDTPHYFAADGDVRNLRQGTIALVVPYGDVRNYLTMDPMLWQAESGFRYRMVAGAMITALPKDISPLVVPTEFGSTLACVMWNLQLGGGAAPCSSHAVAAARAELDQLGVKVIIMGPLGYGAQAHLAPSIEGFLSQVAGRAPRWDEGVDVWPYEP